MYVFINDYLIVFKVSFCELHLPKFSEFCIALASVKSL